MDANPVALIDPWGAESKGPKKNNQTGLYGKGNNRPGSSGNNLGTPKISDFGALITNLLSSLFETSIELETFNEFSESTKRAGTVVEFTPRGSNKKDELDEFKGYEDVLPFGFKDVFAKEKSIWSLEDRSDGKTVFDIEKAVKQLNSNAYPEYDKETCGYCSKAVRQAIEEGGIDTSKRPNSAKDYGPYLEEWGFKPVSPLFYTPKKGDIKVIQNYDGGSVHGHVSMYNGSRWVSDFKETGDWPGPGYRREKPAFKIYRWNDD